MLTACGRLGFDAPPDARAISDANIAYPTAVLASQPRLYLRLEETTGTAAFDSSPAHLDGLYDIDTASLELAQPGAVDRGVRISGDGNAGPNITAVVRVDETAIDWSGDFTVELFVQPERVANASYDNEIFLCETYLTDGFRVGWDEANVIEVWTDEAGGTDTLKSAIPITFGRFNHIAVVREGTRFSIFVDGMLGATAPAFDYRPTQPGAECGTGSFHGMPSYGTFDELAIYSRALPGTELAAHVSAR